MTTAALSGLSAASSSADGVRGRTRSSFTAWPADMTTPLTAKKICSSRNAPIASTVFGRCDIYYICLRITWLPWKKGAFFAYTTYCGMTPADTQRETSFIKNFQNCNIRAVFLSYNPKLYKDNCASQPKNAIKKPFFAPEHPLFFYRKILLLCNHYEYFRVIFRFVMKKTQEIFKKRLQFLRLLCKMYMR